MKLWFKGLHKTECDNIRELLSPYLDNELDFVTRQKVDSHIESCQFCRLELDSFKKTGKLIHNIPVFEPKHSFHVSESMKALSEGKLKPLIITTSVVAILLLIIIIGDITYYFDIAFLPIQPDQNLIVPGPPNPINTPLDLKEYNWPIREIELGLAFILIGLTITIAVYWLRRQVKKAR